MPSYVIHGLNSPIVTVKGSTDFSMFDMVYVGKERLIGEVIRLSSDLTTIQVYENIAGLMPGEPVESSHTPMSVKLGPGLISGIFDGIQRPLESITEGSGAFIGRGIGADPVNPDKKWDVTVDVKAGDHVKAGDIIAHCPETPLITHKVMVPYGIEGEVAEAVPNGQYTVNDVIVKVKDKKGKVHGLTMVQYWPIRKPRPSAGRLPLSAPLVTGQRVIDTMFPVAKGGAAAIPGGFGTGKTMIQHQFAKWSDADIIVYIGCGERGNEMTQVLTEFAELVDPKSKQPLTYRTIFIANTSNMPVAAREASIYTGVTLAEYYRDMGYHVAIMADSTSRWAEALREISGRLEEMPAEEGFPPYLPSRLSEFYERAGYFKTLSGKEGSITIIGAVSPQGSDFSEPVTQNTKRFVRCFWALDRQLAYSRHYPAVDWNTSYSEYFEELDSWYNNIAHDFVACRKRMAALLQEESRLMEIVKLIGADVLPDDQKLVIEVARVIRVGFLQQNAYHDMDTYVPIEKQYRMMKTILRLYDRAREIVSENIPLSRLKETGIFDKAVKMKYEIPSDRMDLFDKLDIEIDDLVAKVKDANAVK